MRYVFKGLKWLCFATPFVLGVYQFVSFSPNDIATVDLAAGIFVKISFIGLASVLLVLMFTKKFWYTSIVGEFLTMSANIKTALMIETDNKKIANAKKALKKIGTKLVLLKAIQPIIGILIIIVISLALERALVQLTSTLLYGLCAFVVGVIFNLLEINSGSKGV